MHLLDRVDALSFAWDGHRHLWLGLLLLLLLELLGLEELLLLLCLLLHDHCGNRVEFVLMRSCAWNSEKLVLVSIAISIELIVFHADEWVA